jgi:hypothetical protein
MSAINRGKGRSKAGFFIREPPFCYPKLAVALKRSRECSGVIVQSRLSHGLVA